jgi:hypothetical protein
MSALVATVGVRHVDPAGTPQIDRLHTGGNAHATAAEVAVRLARAVARVHARLRAARR